MLSPCQHRARIVTRRLDALERNDHAVWEAETAALAEWRAGQRPKPPLIYGILVSLGVADEDVERFIAGEVQ